MERLAIPGKLTERGFKNKVYRTFPTVRHAINLRRRIGATFSDSRLLPSGFSPCLCFLLRQRQESFAHYLVIFDRVNADLGHLHPLFRVLIRRIDVKAHYKGIARDKWSAHP
jgi:hypothetical protein